MPSQRPLRFKILTPLSSVPSVSSVVNDFCPFNKKPAPFYRAGATENSANRYLQVVNLNEASRVSKLKLPLVL